MSSEFTDSDFLINYQSNKFKDSPKDPFASVIFKRRCMLLSLAHSSKSLNNASSCHIFEDQLQEYCGLVDNRKGVNNFAKVTLDLLSNVKNVSKSWKSGLPDTPPELSKLLKPLKGDCLNPTKDDVCGNIFPPSSLINQLMGSAQLPINEKPVPSTSTVQTTLDGFRRASNTIDQTRGREKRSLYSSYQDFQKVENRNKAPQEDTSPRNNFIDKKKHSLYSSYGPTTNSKPKQITEFQSRQRGKFDRKNNQKNFSTSQSDMDQEEPFEKSGIYHKFPGGKGYARNSKPIFTCGGFQNSSGNENEEEPQRMDFDTHFKTASKELQISNQKKFGNQRGGRTDYDRGYGGGGSGGYERTSGFQPHVAVKKFLGGKRSVSSKFVPPVKNNSLEEEYRPKENVDPESELDERLKNIEPRMIELIQNEIMDCGSKIGWDDIAGLEFAKSTIQEIVVWPMLRPDIFTGLRRPPKGILLFGPPGTGKTLIGKCIASQSNSTFFSISASSLTSKWIGDGEKMVRALFAVARVHQPSVVFIDEIDSLLSQRSDTEHESSRRIKTEFLVQLDGAATGEEDRILVIGATNRPQELDEAARRRLVKRLYIPLPDKEARKQLTQNLVKLERNDLTPEDIEEISSLTEGYSGADMKNLCQEASLGPIRSISSKDMFQISPDQVRPVNISDFKMALKRVKSSVSPKDLEIYLQWDQQYGSGAFSV